MAIQPRCSLGALDPMLLGHPLTVLNLTVRASNCLSDVPTLSALLEFSESQLMRQRHFGRTSLADVRRKMVHFCVDHLAVGPAHPIRVALYDPHPAISAVWNAPPQARTLGEVVEDLLEVLSRPEELRAAGAWTYSTRQIGPPRPLDLQSASLAEVIESFLQPLRARERRMLELRYGPLDGAGATLAEIGGEFGLTRERVRQILQACLQRLSLDSEQQRRRPLTEFVAVTLREAGGLMAERGLATALQRRFPPPHAECGPCLRLLMEAEPGFAPAGRGVWASAEVSLEMVAELREAFRAALRAAGRPLHRDELLRLGTARAPAAGETASEAFRLGCMTTDERLRRYEGDRIGLAEWQWLLPSSLEDYIYLALRAAGRPRHYTWITEQVNTLVPDGSEVTSRDVHSALLERPERFARTREGTYGLGAAP